MNNTLRLLEHLWYLSRFTVVASLYTKQSMGQAPCNQGSDVVNSECSCCHWGHWLHVPAEKTTSRKMQLTCSYFFNLFQRYAHFSFCFCSLFRFIWPFHQLGGGFDWFLHLLPRFLGRWSNLTSVVEVYSWGPWVIFVEGWEWQP